MILLCLQLNVLIEAGSKVTGSTHNNKKIWLIYLATLSSQSKSAKVRLFDCFRVSCQIFLRCDPDQGQLRRQRKEKSLFINMLNMHKQKSSCAGGNTEEI